MSNMNRIFLIGTVQAKPETRFAMENNNSSISKFTLSVARAPRRDGQIDYDNMPVVAWGKAADYVAENLQQGSVAIVEGRIQTSSRENNGQRLYQTEINASTIKLFKAGTAQVTTAPQAVATPTPSTPPETAGNPFGGTQDDTPFDN